MSTYELASEGVHPATLVDMAIQPTKNGSHFAIPRFRMLDEKASATSLLFLKGDDGKRFLQRVPGYMGAAFDELQLLGRSAQVHVTHSPDQSSGKTFANVDLRSVEWEQEPERPTEKDTDPKILLITSHYAKGELSGKCFYRLVGQSQVRAKEFAGSSAFDLAASGVRYFLAKAKAKKVRVRIFTDLKPLTQKAEIQDVATDSRCSLHWQAGGLLKRWLFRGLREPYAGTKKASANAPVETEFDELFG
jgi:hypothetical protein